MNRAVRAGGSRADGMRRTWVAMAGVTLENQSMLARPTVFSSLLTMP